MILGAKTGRLPLVRFRRTLQLIWISNPGLSVVVVVVALVQGFVPLVLLYIVKLIIDAFAVALVVPGAANGAVGEVTLLILLAAGVALAQSGLGAAARIVADLQAEAVSDHMHDLIHAKSIAVDLSFYENALY